LHTFYNTFIANIYNTTRHEIYKEAITCILSVINKNKITILNEIILVHHDSNYGKYIHTRHDNIILKNCLTIVIHVFSDDPYTSFVLRG